VSGSGRVGIISAVLGVRVVVALADEALPSLFTTIPAGTTWRAGSSALNLGRRGGEIQAIAWHLQLPIRLFKLQSAVWELPR